MTIREIAADYLALIELAEDPEIDEQIWADTFEGLNGELEDKADAYATVMAELKGKAATVKAEADRLAARYKTINNSIERIKKNLEEVMKATGKTKFKTDLYSFNIQKNPASLRLADDLDFATIPAEYIKFADPEIDKAKVKEALKAGEEFPWAHMEQTEGLRIR